MAHPHTDDVAARLARTIWLDVEDVANRFKVTPSTIWRWTRDKNGSFPQPMRLTPRVTRWRLEDIEEFEADLMRNAA